MLRFWGPPPLRQWGCLIWELFQDRKSDRNRSCPPWDSTNLLKSHFLNLWLRGQKRGSWWKWCLYRASLKLGVFTLHWCTYQYWRSVVSYVCMPDRVRPSVHPGALATWSRHVSNTQYHIYHIPCIPHSRSYIGWDSPVFPYIRMFFFGHPQVFCFASSDPAFQRWACRLSMAEEQMLQAKSEASALRSQLQARALKGGVSWGNQLGVSWNGGHPKWRLYNGKSH